MLISNQFRSVAQTEKSKHKDMQDTKMLPSRKKEFPTMLAEEEQILAKKIEILKKNASKEKT